MCVWKDKNKWKRGLVWHIFKKAHIERYANGKRFLTTKDFKIKVANFFRKLPPKLYMSGHINLFDYWAKKLKYQFDETVPLI